MVSDDKLSHVPACAIHSRLCSSGEEINTCFQELSGRAAHPEQLPCTAMAPWFPWGWIPGLGLCTPFPGTAQSQAALLAPSMAPGGTQDSQPCAGTVVALTHRVALTGVENCAEVFCWDILAGHGAQATPGCCVEGTAMVQLRGEQGKETKLSAAKD